MRDHARPFMILSYTMVKLSNPSTSDYRPPRIISALAKSTLMKQIIVILTVAESPLLVLSFYGECLGGRGFVTVLPKDRVTSALG